MIKSKALENCTWPGRFQVMWGKGVTYYVDGAHTEHSIRVILLILLCYFIILIFMILFFFYLIIFHFIVFVYYFLHYCFSLFSISLFFSAFPPYSFLHHCRLYYAGHASIFIRLNVNAVFYIRINKQG